MRIKLFSTLLIVTMILFVGVSIVSAQCSPSTQGDDTIVCEGVVGPDMSGNGGDDIIINNATVTGVGNYPLGAIEGNVGDDTIVNNSTGLTDWIDGNDGNDTIINNGTVGMGMMGYDGDDTIINNGNVGGMMVGMDGNDTIIINTANATTGGDYHVGLDGGADTDTLQFDFYVQADYDAAALVLSAADPAGGSIVINGVNYTWLNFEQLLAILQEAIPDYSSGDVVIVDLTPDEGETSQGDESGGTTIIITTTVTNGRLNYDDSASVALFCAAGGYQAYSVEGLFLINVDPAVVTEGLASAAAQQQHVLLGQNEQVTLWALYTNEIQVQDDASGYKFIIASNVCSS
jgi:hypothetical protein